jgi:hypothetical protein
MVVSVARVELSRILAQVSEPWVEDGAGKLTALPSFFTKQRTKHASSMLVCCTSLPPASSVILLTPGLETELDDAP